MATAHKTTEGTWRVQVYAGKDENGKRKYISITERTRREAERKALQIKADMEEAQKIQDAGITVGEAAKEYIDAKSRILEESTLTGYRRIIKNFMPDDLLSTPCSMLTRQQVQHWINDLAEEHSGKTCANAHGFLSAVVSFQGFDANFRTTLPPRKKAEIYVPDEAEVKNILQKAKGTRLYIPVVLATQCGLRASEISGLTIDNVHDDYISITQARVDTDHGAVTKGTKSTAGTRDVPCNLAIATLLREAAGADGLVCSMRVTDISSTWGKFRAKHNLPKALNFHALRHHYASKCILHKIPDKYAAEMMGHATLDMLHRVYQHTFPSAKSKFAQQMRDSMVETI